MSGAATEQPSCVMAAAGLISAEIFLIGSLPYITDFWDSRKPGHQLAGREHPRSSTGKEQATNFIIYCCINTSEKCPSHAPNPERNLCLVAPNQEFNMSLLFNSLSQTTKQQQILTKEKTCAGVYRKQNFYSAVTFSNNQV